MIHIIVNLIFAFAVVLLSGHLLLFIVDSGGELRLGTLSKNSISLLFGLGALSLQLFFYSVMGVGVTPASVFMPWVLLFVLSFFLYRTGLLKRRANTATNQFTNRSGVVEILSMVIILAQVAYSVFYSVALPITGWDAWSIWFLKARAFFVDGGVTPRFLLDSSYGYAHADYPLLLPLTISWFFTLLGTVNDIAVKILYPVQFVALLSLVYYFVRRSVGRRTALVSAALLSLVPLVIIHSAGLPVKIGGLYSGDFVGYADLTLSLFFVAAGGFIYLYAKEGNAAALRAAALTLAIGAWVKNEGMVFALSGATVLFILLLLRNLNLPFSSSLCDNPGSVDGGVKKNGGRGVRPVVSGLLFIVAVLALFILPWALYKAQLGLGSEYAGGLNMGTITANIERLPFVVSSILGSLFLRPGLVNIIWWVLVASIALNIRGIMRPGVIALLILLLFQFAVYTFVYVITPADVAWQVSTSLDRLVLHLTPLALLIAALNSRGCLER